MSKLFNLSEEEKNRILILHEDAKKIQYLSEETVDYVVKSGDSLSKIAAKNNTTIKNILSVNNIPDINRIKIGQILKIPKNNSTPSLNPKPEEKEKEQNTNKIIKSISYDNLYNNFPKNSSAKDIFPVIFPKEYKERPHEFQNACATRLSLALNKVGVKPDSKFKTQQPLVYNGIKYDKGLPITASAVQTPPYLKRALGPPSFSGANKMDVLEKNLKGKKGIFVITKVPGWEASGHADIFSAESGNFKCGYSCHFGQGGIIQAWFVS
jgi:LysM repeat protein